MILRAVIFPILGLLFFCSSDAVSIIRFDPEFFYIFLLPPIIFEAGARRSLWGQILLLAVSVVQWGTSIWTYTSNPGAAFVIRSCASIRGVNNAPTLIEA